MTEQTRYKIILFDGVCIFCNFWVDFILERDEKNVFKFTPIQSDAGKRYIKKLSIDVVENDSIILIEGNNFFTHSTAVLTILKELKYPWPIFNFFRFIPKFIRDPLYRLVAKYRYKIFGKKEKCRIPTEKDREKILYY